jgi:excisionase family DNA binding protein
MKAQGSTSDNVFSARLLTVAQAAEKLNISYRELFRWIERGDLPVIRLSMRLIRIDPKDLDSLIASKREEGE